MWKAAKLLDQDLSSLITEMLQELRREDPESGTTKTLTLTLTGHSLGAGTATLLGLIWSRKQEINAVWRNVELACFAFATPQTMNEDAARIMGSIYRRQASRSTGVVP